MKPSKHVIGIHGEFWKYAENMGSRQEDNLVRGSLIPHCWTLSAIATRLPLDDALLPWWCSPLCVKLRPSAGATPSPAASLGQTLLTEVSQGKRELSRHCGFSDQFITKYTLSAYHVLDSVLGAGATAVIRDKVPAPPPHGVAFCRGEKTGAPKQIEKRTSGIT